VKRKGSAIWQGGLRAGSGKISTESGVLSGVQYSFGTRFENGIGTNPEELLGAAHAGCFSMQLSASLEAAGLKPQSVETTASVTLEKDGSGFKVTEVHLDVKASVPGASQAKFDQIANEAKVGCPVSKLFNAKIVMTAKLKD
jgi:osmotically inducible protein OsmC